MVGETNRPQDPTLADPVEEGSQPESGRRRSDRRGRWTFQRLRSHPHCIPIWNVSWLAVLLLGFLLWRSVYVDSWISLFNPWFITVFVAVVAVAVFIWKSILPQERTEALGKKLQAYFLNSRVVAILLPVLTLSCVGLGCCYATVELEGSQEPFQVQMGPAGSTLETYEFPDLGETHRVPFFLPISSREVEIKSPYCPRKRIRLRPFGKTRIDADSLFAHPTVLLLPTLDLIECAHSGPLILEVTINGEPYEMEYGGEAVWIGVEPELMVPPWVKEDWPDKFPDTSREMFDHWSKPVTVPSAPTRLEDRAEITVRLFHQGDDGSRGALPLDQGLFELETPQSRRGFPQQEPIDVAR